MEAPSSIKSLAQVENSSGPTSYTVSPSTRLSLTSIAAVGERLNPTGRPPMKEALYSKNYDYAFGPAAEQEEEGADFLVVNAGLPDIDEGEALTGLVNAIQKISPLPLVIDCSNPAALERALRVCRGRPVLNSICGHQESLENILPLAVKYGTGLIVLALDSGGISANPQDRCDTALRIIDNGDIQSRCQARRQKRAVQLVPSRQAVAYVGYPQDCFIPQVINEHIIPALDRVGQRYEDGSVFLPQLMASAEAAQAAFETVRRRMPRTERLGHHRPAYHHFAGCSSLPKGPDGNGNVLRRSGHEGTEPHQRSAGLFTRLTLGFHVRLERL